MSVPNTALPPPSAAPLQPNQILRIPETGSYVGLSRAQIYVLIKAGNFAPIVRMSPRRVGFRVKDLDAWIESKLPAPQEVQS